MSRSLIKVEGLHKKFLISRQQKRYNHVLKGIDLNINQGEFVILFGPSGCGKTTLINCLIGLEPVSKGKIVIDKNCITDMNVDERAEFRCHHLGIFYQMPYWVKSLTVIENVALPLLIDNKNEEKSLKKAQQVLDQVGLKNRSEYSPTELSGGEQQRVGLARALIGQSMIILADEPTGNLDVKSGRELMNLLKKINREGRTIVLITHNLDYLSYADRKIGMEDGRIVADSAVSGSKLAQAFEKKIKMLKEEEKKII